MLLRALVPLLAAAALPAAAAAAPGLDPSFGDRGRTVVPADVMREASELTLAGDGLAVAGPTAEGLAFARYGLDGRLDPAFGDGGVSRLDDPLEADAAWEIEVVDLLAEPDGSLTARYHDNAGLNRGGSDSPPCFARVGPAGDPASMVSGLACGSDPFGSLRPRPGGGVLLVESGIRDTTIRALGPDLAPDPGWGRAGRWTTRPQAQQVVTNAAGEVLVVKHRSIEQLDPAGQPVATTPLPPTARPRSTTLAAAAMRDGQALVLRAVSRRRSSCRLVVSRVAVAPEGDGAVHQRGRRFDRCPYEAEVAFQGADAGLLLLVMPARGRVQGVPAARLAVAQIGPGSRIGAPVRFGERVHDETGFVDATTLPDGRVVALVPDSVTESTLLAFAAP